MGCTNGKTKTDKSQLKSVLSIKPFRFKLVMLGDASVGKTSIINRYIDDRFSERNFATIGSSYGEKEFFTSNGQLVTLEIWDTGGQERFRCLVPLYYRDASAAVVVFAIDSQISYTRSQGWVEEIKREREDCHIVFVGNKLDCQDRVVSDETAGQYAKSEGLKYVEVSAKSGEGILELFDSIADHLARKHENFVDLT